MNTKNIRKPKIIIYGTGLFGCYIARLAFQKGWDIVAAYNRAGAKVGQDLGKLAGLESNIGIVVQDSETASYDKLEADIAIVATTNSLSNNFPAYQRLMGAGINLLCLGTESCYPIGNDPVITPKIDALAKQNGVTFTGGGIWDMSRIWAGILLAGPCTKINSLFHSSITNAANVGKETMLQFGIGLTPEQFKEKGLDKFPTATSYKTIPEHVLFALGYNISNTNTYVEPVVFDVDIDCSLLDDPLPAGICVGMRIIGEIETEEGVTAKAEIDIRLFKEDEAEHMFWSVDGDPVARVKIERENALHSTSACIINRVQDVINAPAGIRLVSQLGPLKHSALPT